MKWILLIGFLATLSCHRQPAQEKWVAAVDDQKILVKDLETLLHRERENYGPELWEDPEGFLAIKKQILQGMIERKTLLNEAERKGLSVPPERVASALQELKGETSDEEFEKQLKENGMTLEEWKEGQREKLLVDQLLQKEVYAQVVSSDDEIKNYYEGHRREFYEPDRVHCQHIVTGKREKAEKIASLLAKGESFATVAQGYSESPDRNRGGDLGFIEKGEYPQVFDTCFQLATGQTSPIVSSDYGFHLFHILEKKRGHYLTLTQSRERIRKTLAEKKGQTALKSWLDRLFQRTKVQVREDVLREVKIDEKK